MACPLAPTVTIATSLEIQTGAVASSAPLLIRFDVVKRCSTPIFMSGFVGAM
jgi:hypothetical protein